MQVASVAAPAGYGKSTLLTQWWQDLCAQKIRCQWLSLDAQDGNPDTFEKALYAALHQPSAVASKDIHSLLEDIQKSAQRRVLFIDDLHFLHAQDAEHVLHWLLHNLPSNLQLILSGRSIPDALGLSRRCLEGTAIRYGTSDLALTKNELSQLFKLDEDEATLNALTQQTEGWPLAARIVMMAQAETGEIAAPSGRDRDLADYLTDALLSGLSTPLQELVFAAALLPRFCAPQLNAILDSSDAQQHILWLEQHNVFVIPLDRERQWYRFHHLISEFLSDRLNHQNPAHKQQWLEKAAHWCEQAGQLEDAVDLALAAQNYEMAAARLDQMTTQLAQHEGQHERIINWVAQLPEDVVQRYYRLRLNHIMAITFTGGLEQARLSATQLLRDVAGVVDETQEAEFQSAASVFACIIAALEDEPDLALELSVEWLEKWPNASPLFTGAACSTRGFAAKCQSAFEESLAWTQRGRQLFVQAGSAYGEAWAAALQAITLLRMGNLTAARTVAENTYQLSVRRLGKQAPGSCTLAAILASIYLEMGDTDKSTAMLDFDFSALGVQTSTDGLLAGWLTAARLKSLSAQPKAAQALLLDGEAIGQERGMPRLVLTLAAERATNHIRAGRLELARTIMNTEFSPYDSREDLANLIADKRLQLETRLALATGEGETVWSDICQQIRRAQANEQALKVMQWQLFAAAANQGEASLNALVSCLESAAETAAIRILMADHELVRPLLPAAIEKAKLSSHFAQQLQQAVNIDALASAAQLTKKEQKILAAAESGLSNKELAAQLFVSEGTVKWHLHNIYNKLDAKNRSDALAKARAAGLI